MGPRGDEPDDLDDPDGLDGPDDRVDLDEPLPLPPLSNRGWGVLLPVTGGFGQSPVIHQPDASTPLEAGEVDTVVPATLLWSMKFLRHGRSGPDRGVEDADRIRWSSDDEEPRSAVYAIDDGYGHCMVGRLVGASPDGATYCLVARVKHLDFDEVRGGWAAAADLFSLAKEFALTAVSEGSVSNVVRVAGYRRYRDVPAEYLPPSPYIEFDETM